MTTERPTKTECPECHWTGGHWAFCKASTRSDWDRLGEPFASDLAKTRAGGR